MLFLVGKIEVRALKSGMIEKILIFNHVCLVGRIKSRMIENKYNFLLKDTFNKMDWKKYGRIVEAYLGAWTMNVGYIGRLLDF